MCAAALARRGIELHDAQGPLEHARSIKSAEELLCMNYSLAVADIAMARMREALKPGVTENELFAILYHTNIAMGGEWIDARMLTSGDRTNPWLQEASERRIRPGELVAFDADMVCIDCRVGLQVVECSPGSPSPGTQRAPILRLARLAVIGEADDTAGQSGAVIGLNAGRIEQREAPAIGDQLPSVGRIAIRVPLRKLKWTWRLRFIRWMLFENLL